VVENRKSPVQKLSELFGRVLRKVAVRIIPGRKLNDMTGYLLGKQELHSPEGSLFTCAVAVEKEIQLVGITPQNLQMAFGKSCSAGSHHIRDPASVECEMIEIALYDDRGSLLPHRLPGKIDTEQYFTFQINRRFRRVYVLGQRIVENPPAETDRLPVNIGNGKDQPVPEQIEVPASALALYQPEFFNLLRSYPFLLQKSYQSVPTIRGISQTIGRDHLPLDAATGKISATGIAGRVIL